MASLTHLKQQQNELQKQYDDLSGRISSVREAQAIETNPEIRYQHEKRIEKLEKERTELDQKLESIEKEIKAKKLEARFQELQHPTQAQIDDLQRQLERFQQAQLQAGRIRQKSRRKSVGLKPGVEKHFVNRMAHLDDLSNSVGDDGMRFILVVGQAGIGKTALVAKFCDEIEKAGYKSAQLSKSSKLLESSENLESSLPIRAIVYVNKSEMVSFTIDQIFEKILLTLDKEDIERIESTIREPKIGVVPKTNLILDCLQDETSLIILDNFETMLDETSINDPDLQLFIETVCESSHKAKLIVTSRRNVELENIFAQKKNIRLDKGLDGKHSVEFLRKLASDTIEQITTATDKELEKLAEKVYGVPMALRSLASFLKKQRRLTILDLLQDESKYDDFKKHDIEKGLRKLIAEQFENLSSDAKLALQVIALYNGPVQAVAVQYLLPALDAQNAVDCLLYDYFLVQKNRTYLELHPTVQEYGYELIPKGDPKTLQTKFNRFDYLWKSHKPEQSNEFTRASLHAHAADFFAQSKKPEKEWKTITDLQPHLDEFRQRVKAEQYDRAGYLLLEIDFDYLQLWGHSLLVSELREQLIGKLTDKYLIQVNYGHLGLAYQNIGRVKEAIQFYEKALESARKEKNKHGEGRWVGCFGLAYSDLGDIQRAIEYYEQALAIAKEIGDKSNEGVWLSNLGNAYYSLGDVSRAIDFYEDALKISREIGDKRGEGTDRGNLGEVYLEMCVQQSTDRWLSTAIEYHQRALEIAKEIAHATGLCNRIRMLGLDYLFGSDLAQAVGYFQGCVAACEQVLSQSQLYEVMYYRAFSLLALESLGKELSGFQNLTGLAMEAYQAALSVNSASGVLREAIHEMARLKKIFKMREKELPTIVDLSTLEAVLALLEEALLR